MYRECISEFAPRAKNSPEKSRDTALGVLRARTHARTQAYKVQKLTHTPAAPRRDSRTRRASTASASFSGRVGNAQGCTILVITPQSCVDRLNYRRDRSINRPLVPFLSSQPPFGKEKKHGAPKRHVLQDLNPRRGSPEAHLLPRRQGIRVRRNEVNRKTRTSRCAVNGARGKKTERSSTKHEARSTRTHARTRLQ